MLRVKDCHLHAISRAIHFVRSGLTTKMSPKLIDQINHDIDLLDEVHRFCRQQIIEPGLAMQPDLESVGLHGEIDGNDSKTATD